ncbi:triacylglycerol lipase [Dorcoceras hygrometricum]|uniref:Triacylglycerol lipase n=1 Tax=Dorcoceras hygrometricum TaxID=472368 RepID=A0A2Z7ABP7_9LAMI|nr:triacylglycerol lipase [Dorcoceras hygrometricum]
MVKRLETSRHDSLGITDSACKNQLVVVSVQYGPFNTYIPIRSTTTGKSRVARDPITMHTSWRSNSDIASVTSERIMVKRLETSRHDSLGITDSACKNQLVVVSVQYGPFNTYIPIRSTTTGKSRVARDPITMHTSWRSNSDIASVTRTNQYKKDLGLFHSTNGNHLESPNEGSSIDHQVTIHLHAQNITMFPINETWYFASQMLVSSSGGLILILTAQ